MKHSEFWACLDRIYGSAYGRSLVMDLVLTKFGLTANEALEKGHKPLEVWQALVVETGADDSALWAHREDRRKGKKIR